MRPATAGFAREAQARAGNPGARSPAHARGASPSGAAVTSSTRAVTCAQPGHREWGLRSRPRTPCPTSAAPCMQACHRSLLQGGGGACGRRPHSRCPERRQGTGVLTRQPLHAALRARERGPENAGAAPALPQGRSQRPSRRPSPAPRDKKSNALAPLRPRRRPAVPRRRRSPALPRHPGRSRAAARAAARPRARPCPRARRPAIRAAAARRWPC